MERKERLDEIESRFNRIDTQPSADNKHLRDSSKYKDLFKSVKSLGKKEDDELLNVVESALVYNDFEPKLL